MANIYNWGYSLHISVQNFSPNMATFYTPLKHPNADAESYANLIRTIKSGIFCKDYQNIVHLKGSNATCIEVIKGILNLAKIAEIGDIVTITFSGHGKSSGKTNSWLLYDGMIKDFEIYQLFKLFNPQVRIILISDCCSSHTMLDSEPHSNSLKHLDKLMDRLRKADPIMAFRLNFMLNSTKETKVLCSVTSITAVSADETPVNDYYSLNRYMEMYLEKYGSIVHNMDDLMKEIRAFAIKTFSNNPELFRFLEHGVLGDNNPFNINNPLDVAHLKRILPQLNTINSQLSRDSAKLAFHV